MYVKWTTTTVDNCAFKQLRADNCGAGIYAVWSLVTVTDTLFSDLIATWGAVLYGDDATFELGGNWCVLEEGGRGRG